MEKAEKKSEIPQVNPQVDRKLLGMVDERIKKLSSVLGNKQVRSAWEKKDAEIAAQEIKKRLVRK